MKEEVLSALMKVIDPETGIDVVKMGMIKSVSIKDGVATINFVPTTPFCPMIGYLVDQIKQAAKTVKGVKEAEVRVG